MLTLTGSGFDPDNCNVTICGEECTVNRMTSTSSQLHCWSPLYNGTFQTCSKSTLNKKKKKAKAFHSKNNMDIFVLVSFLSHENK